MLKVLRTLEKKRAISDRLMTLVWVECLNCGHQYEMAEQNAMKHNRKNQTHCYHCIKDTFHYMTGTRIWRIWMGLKARVKDPASPDYSNYGGRGIKLSSRWEDFQNFYEDMSPGYSDDLTIERINVNGDYCKENCTWVSAFDQQSNKRNNRFVVYQGETIHLAELCRRSGQSKMKLVMRLNRGMTADEAVMDAINSPYGKSCRPVDIKRRQKRTSTT